MEELNKQKAERDANEAKRLAVDAAIVAAEAKKRVEEAASKSDAHEDAAEEFNKKKEQAKGEAHKVAVEGVSD